MENQISLLEWCRNYTAGKYASADRKTQCEAGWYDWFCKDEGLKRRLDAMAPLVTSIMLSAKFDPTKVYVFFKNNCPMRGPLYDSFSICDLVSGDVLFHVALNDKRMDHPANVSSPENDFNDPVFSGSKKEMTNWFMGRECNNLAPKKQEAVATA